MKVLIILLIVISFISGCSHSNSKIDDPILLRLKASSVNKRRTAEEIKRNKFRNPVKTLSFFGIEPDMTVVEVSPSGGWYSSIIGPFLRKTGTLYLAAFDPNSDKEYRRNATKKLKKRVGESPDYYGKVIFTVFESPKKIAPVAPDKDSVDMVLTFRNTHNWIGEKTALSSFKEFFRVLKPGGTFGLVQHRANENTLDKDNKLYKTGYVKESVIIALAEKAGFYLDSKSEINANPKDTKDYEKGVWTLPPVYRLKDLDKAKYKRIGESDRMTLKFIKPTK